MSAAASVIARNRASVDEVARHLHACNASFVPPLDARVDLSSYAAKIVAHAERFEAWHDGRLVALVAAYCNAPDRAFAHVTNVSVLPDLLRRGLASMLLRHCLEHVQAMGFAKIELDVDLGNEPALALYLRHGFRHTVKGKLVRQLGPLKDPTMNNPRDYDSEIKDATDHRYAYGFDFDVMHPFMLRSFEPFLRAGNLLELGSFKGDFTQRFLPYFEDITCVEASADAIAAARSRFGDRLQLVHSTFENAELPRRYDNIVMTHVLEHLDDPVRVLKRINDEWLADGGRFFLVCPNANAPSRQIAVKMGLISHNAAVTPAEAEHGHRITYSLDTLERDAVRAGLQVVHRSGIFFKALANFQWDRLLATDIVSKEYLDGCYQLGHVYPDLCSSIFLVCERGARPGA
jgi:GNAT superfamily N-acetyltransferase/SAM-dependent methyltransferase